MRKGTFLLVVILTISVGSCTKVTSETETHGRANSLTRQSPTPTLESEKNDNTNPIKVLENRKLYMGCWSSGNGNTLRISATTLQTRNSYVQLKYKDVTDDLAVKKDLYLLETLDIDKSNEFQKYLTFRILPNDEMEGMDFDSYDDFVNGQYSGLHSRWVRDKCDTERGSSN